MTYYCFFWKQLCYYYFFWKQVCCHHFFWTKWPTTVSSEKKYATAIFLLKKVRHYFFLKINMPLLFLLKTTIVLPFLKQLCCHHLGVCGGREVSYYSFFWKQICYCYFFWKQVSYYLFFWNKVSCYCNEVVWVKFIRVITRVATKMYSSYALTKGGGLGRWVYLSYAWVCSSNFIFLKIFISRIF